MQKTFQVAVLAGDGIGPEITAEAIKVLRYIESQSSVTFDLVMADFGASAWFKTGKSFPEETKQICDQADVILKGTIGLSHEQSQQIPVDERPERGALLPMRRRYDTFANFRPVYLPKEIAHFSPLKPEVVGDGIDILIIRELVGGLYFGEKETGIDEQGRRYAREILDYNEEQIIRIVDIAFQWAMKRRKKLQHIHKSNVLKSSVLWTDIVNEISKGYPEVTVEHVLVDAAATYLCLRPTDFDVMVMENLFGDILSDQAGGILGSLGLMPSACIGPEKSYFEPSHGSAPDIAGMNKANPYSMIASVAMMLEMNFAMAKEAHQIMQALKQVFSDGFCTSDIGHLNKGMSIIGTDEFGDRVVAALAQQFS